MCLLNLSTLPCVNSFLWAAPIMRINLQTGPCCSKLLACWPTNQGLVEGYEVEFKWTSLTQGTFSTAGHLSGLRSTFQQSTVHSTFQQSCSSFRLEKYKFWVLTPSCTSSWETPWLDFLTTVFYCNRCKYLFWRLCFYCNWCNYLLWRLAILGTHDGVPIYILMPVLAQLR